MIAKNNITIEKEKRQLLSSWTLELANTFSYMKANGEIRQARGTLCHGISDDFDHYEYKAEDADTFTRVLRRGVYVYFDLDRRAFRTFSAHSLIDN